MDSTQTIDLELLPVEISISSLLFFFFKVHKYLAIVLIHTLFSPQQQFTKFRVTLLIKKEINLLFSLFSVGVIENSHDKITISVSQLLLGWHILLFTAPTKPDL